MRYPNFQIVVLCPRDVKSDNYFQLQCITYTFVCVWRLFIIRTYLSGNSIVGSYTCSYTCKGLFSLQAESVFDIDFKCML